MLDPRFSRTLYKEQSIYTPTSNARGFDSEEQMSRVPHPSTNVSSSYFTSQNSTQKVPYFPPPNFPKPTNYDPAFNSGSG